MTSTRRRRPPRVLTPVEITARFPSFNGRRLETWSAKSADGLWTYERVEITGTPWQVTHVPTGKQPAWHGNIDDARAATADGTALAEVNRMLAHDRDEHAAERDPACRQC